MNHLGNSGPFVFRAPVSSHFLALQNAGGGLSG